MDDVIEQLAGQRGRFFHACNGRCIVEQYAIVMYGVWDDAGVGVGREEGGWIVVVVGMVFIIPAVVQIMVDRMLYRLSWQGRIWNHGI